MIMIFLDQQMNIYAPRPIYRPSPIRRYFFYDEVNIDKMLRFGKNKRQIDANGAINLRK